VFRLSDLRLCNFKAFKRAHVRFRPITVLIGPNSSGKSTIIQAMLLLKQTLAKAIVDNVPLALTGLHNFGDFEALVFKGEREISVELILGGSESYFFTVRGSMQRVSFDLVEVKINGREVGRRKRLGFLVEHPIAKDVEDSFKSVYYLGPLRQEPKPVYEVKGEPFEWIGSKGEKTVDVLVMREEVKEAVGKWLVNHGLAKLSSGRRKKVGLDVVNLRKGTEAYSVYLYDTKTGWKVNFNEVGFGYSQLLPILVGALAVKSGSLIMLEQPEIHLNPSIIPKLVEFFVEQSREKSFLIETHSEVLLLKLQAMVAEGLVSKDDVAVYYTERTPSGSKIRLVDLRDSGEFEDWPEGFFMDRAALVYERYKALMSA